VKKPKLVPPCTGWREDLPGPYESPVVEPTLGLDTPNHQDEVFLELPRASALIRGVVIWFVPILSIQMLNILWSFLSAERTLDFAEWFFFIFTVLAGAWVIPIVWRFDVSAPRDQPLRFNRTRQRIYAYNFKYRWWNPFERWHVIPVAYDWSQVRAERWWVSVGTTFRCGVELSIVKPGTNEVIDRFSLTAMGANEHAWAYVCTYMQQGPDALPPPDDPWDHNDVLWCNVAMLLAPKVEWPTDMDLESRTAPL
jgi:hypothetical protein